MSRFHEPDGSSRAEYAVWHEPQLSTYVCGGMRRRFGECFLYPSCASASPTIPQSKRPVSPGGKDILLDDPTLPVRLTIPRPWKIQRTAHLVEGAQAIVTCNVFTSNGSWNGKGFAQELAYTDVINLLSGGTLSHTVMAFLPWCAGKGIASAFGLAPGTPIILWHELNYGIQDTLLCESVVAFNPDFVTLRALHRW